MPTFKELKDCDIITVTYESHPPIHLSWSFLASDGEAQSSIITILSRSSDVTYENFSGEVVTGSLCISGTVKIKTMNSAPGPSPMTGAIRSIFRMRDSYFRNSFERPDVYSTSSFWGSVSNPLNFTGSMIDIPQVLYGEKIKKGTVRLIVDKTTYQGQAVKNINEYVDDEYGCLVSTSVDRSNYNAVVSNIFGTVFYNHGIILFSETGYNEIVPTSMSVNVHFSGTNKIPMNMYICKVEKGEGNFSINPSFVSYLTSSGKNEITTKNPKAFITGIGLYDENYELIGVAKLATPVLNEEKNSMTFKLKLNF